MSADFRFGSKAAVDAKLDRRPVCPWQPTWHALNRPSA